MNTGRYKHTDWHETYAFRRFHLREAITAYKPNARMIEIGSWLLLEAHYGGPWKMIWALFKREVGLFLEHYVTRRIRKIKRRLGFKADNKEAQAMIDRAVQEEAALSEMVRQL